MRERIFQNFRVIMGNGRHRNRFRSRGRSRDSEICVRPSRLHLHTGIPDLHATTADDAGTWSTMWRKRSQLPLPWFWLGATARAAAVEALVASAVANHDRAAVGAGRGVLLALETDLDGARIHRSRLDRRR